MTIICPHSRADNVIWRSVCDGRSFYAHAHGLHKFDHVCVCVTMCASLMHLVAQMQFNVETRIVTDNSYGHRLWVNVSLRLLALPYAHTFEDIIKLIMYIVIVRATYHYHIIYIICICIRLTSTCPHAHPHAHTNTRTHAHQHTSG